MQNRLTDAIASSRADYTEIRLERSWFTAVAYRGSRLEGANSQRRRRRIRPLLSTGVRLGCRVLQRPRPPRRHGRRGPTSFRSRSGSMQPIRLADLPARRDDVRADLDGDVRGISLGEKQQLLERLNQEMLAVRPPDRGHPGRLPRRSHRVLVRQLRRNHAVRASARRDALGRGAGTG